MRQYKIEPAECGCPRYELQEGIQPPSQMFGGHVEGCALDKKKAVKEAPAEAAPVEKKTVEKPPVTKSSTGKKGTK